MYPFWKCNLIERKMEDLYVREPLGHDKVGYD